MSEADAQGRGKERKDCMRQFRVAWDRFSADPARLTEFLRESASGSDESLVDPTTPSVTPECVG